MGCPLEAHGRLLTWLQSGACLPGGGGEQAFRKAKGNNTTRSKQQGRSTEREARPGGERRGGKRGRVSGMDGGRGARVGDTGKPTPQHTKGKDQERERHPRRLLSCPPHRGQVDQIRGARAMWGYLSGCRVDRNVNLFGDRPTRAANMEGGLEVWVLFILVASEFITFDKLRYHLSPACLIYPCLSLLFYDLPVLRPPSPLFTWQTRPLLLLLLPPPHCSCQ